jgi:hypothetical protein
MQTALSNVNIDIASSDVAAHRWRCTRLAQRVRFLFVWFFFDGFFFDWFLFHLFYIRNPFPTLQRRQPVQVTEPRLDGLVHPSTTTNKGNHDGVPNQ